MGLWPFWQPALILYLFVMFMYKYFGKNKDACYCHPSLVRHLIITFLQVKAAKQRK